MCPTTDFHITFFINIPQIVAIWGWNYCITNLPWFRTFYNHGKVLGMLLSLIINMAGSLINYIALAALSGHHCQIFYMVSCMYNMCTSIYTKFLYGWCLLLFVLVSDDVTTPIPIPKFGWIRVRVSQYLHDRFYNITKRAPQNPKSTWRY